MCKDKLIKQTPVRNRRTILDEGINSQVQPIKQEKVEHRPKPAKPPSKKK